MIRLNETEKKSKITANGGKKGMFHWISFRFKKQKECHFNTLGRHKKEKFSYWFQYFSLLETHTHTHTHTHK